MSSPTNTVRLPARTYRRLQGLARTVGKPMSTVIEEAVERYEADQFFRDLDDAYRDLRTQPDAWHGEQAERALLDHTLGDGLDDG